MRTVARAGWVILLAVFVLSAVGKIEDPAAFAFQLEALGIASPWAWPAALGVLFAELFIAIGLLSRRSRRTAAGAAGLLLLTFAVALTWFIVQGKAGAGCGCFGPLLQGKVGPLHVAEVVALSVLAFLCAGYGGFARGSMEDHFHRVASRS
ncbi:MAG TPA: MauE/DoxX family redox-associated membrane protein [Vicinamibacterales bacterium]